MCTDSFSISATPSILLSLLFFIFIFGFFSFSVSPSTPHPHPTPPGRLSFIAYYIFLLGFHVGTLPTSSPTRTQAFNSIFICPSPSRCRHLPPWLASSLCSAVKLVHWGSRKWGLETIEWWEIQRGVCDALLSCREKMSVIHFQDFTFIPVWDVNINTGL